MLEKISLLAVPGCFIFYLFFLQFIFFPFFRATIGLWSDKSTKKVCMTPCLSFSRIISIFVLLFLGGTVVNGIWISPMRASNIDTPLNSIIFKGGVESKQVHFFKGFLFLFHFLCSCVISMRFELPRMSSQWEQCVVCEHAKRSVIM